MNKKMPVIILLLILSIVALVVFKDSIFKDRSPKVQESKPAVKKKEDNPTVQEPEEIQETKELQEPEEEEIDLTDFIAKNIVSKEDEEIASRFVLSLNKAEGFLDPFFSNYLYSEGKLKEMSKDFPFIEKILDNKKFDKLQSHDFGLLNYNFFLKRFLTGANSEEVFLDYDALTYDIL